MLKDLNPDELKLADLMSQISEDSLSAGRPIEVIISKMRMLDNL